LPVNAARSLRTAHKTKLVLALYALALPVHATPMNHRVPLFVEERQNLSVFGLSDRRHKDATMILIRPIVSAMDRFAKKFTFLEV
jgi:hypothetical protein